MSVAVMIMANIITEKEKTNEDPDTDDHNSVYGIARHGR